MKNITREMIRLYDLKKWGVDFAGFYFSNTEQLSYHHNIIAARDGGPETIQNGVILNGKTSHPYIHQIERIDPEIFYLITSEMLDENIKGKLDVDNLRKINDLLKYFEKEHLDDTTKSGKKLIKRQFIVGRMKF